MAPPFSAKAVDRKPPGFALLHLCISTPQKGRDAVSLVHEDPLNVSGTELAEIRLVRLQAQVPRKTAHTDSHRGRRLSKPVRKTGAPRSETSYPAGFPVAG